MKAVCLAECWVVLKAESSAVWKVERRAEHSVRLRIDETAAQMADLMEKPTADK